MHGEDTIRPLDNVPIISSVVEVHTIVGAVAAYIEITFKKLKWYSTPKEVKYGLV